MSGYRMPSKWGGRPARPTLRRCSLRRSLVRQHRRSMRSGSRSRVTRGPTQLAPSATKSWSRPQISLASASERQAASHSTTSRSSGYDRIDRMTRVHVSARHHRDLLVSAVNDLNRLDREEALAALAAILRTRLLATPERVELRPAEVSYARLVDATERLLLDDAEHGRRAQAVVAAAFDLIFDVVRVERINSPSRHFPGDVVALVDGLPAVERRSAPEACQRR